MRCFAFFQLAFLVLSPAAWAEHPRHELCKKYIPSPGQGRPPPDHSREGFQFVEDCARGDKWTRAEGSAQMKTVLTGLSRTFNQVLPVYSCFRSQEAQNYILCLNECISNDLRLAPSFGSRECSGRIAATQSEHTYGVAADFRVNVNLAPGSSNEVTIREIKKYCRVLDRARKSFAGGWGGITVYGIESGKSFMHYDTKRDWCNWSKHCEDELGEGHCKRKKFNDNLMRLEQRMADAKRANDLTAVIRLEAALRRIRAECPPGDLRCRDNFKNPDL